MTSSPVYILCTLLAVENSLVVWTASILSRLSFPIIPVSENFLHVVVKWRLSEELS